MSEFFKAELKDRFLQYANERDDFFEVQLLYDEFLRPNYSLEYTQKLVHEIMEYDPGLLDVMSGNGTNYFMVSATDGTEDFLEEGGFTDLFIKEEEKWDHFLEHLSYNIKATTKESLLLGKSEKKMPKTERHTLKALFVAIAVCFALTVFSLAKSTFFNDNYVTRQEFQDTLNGLRDERQKTVTSKSDQDSDPVNQQKDSLAINMPPPKPGN